MDLTQTDFEGQKFKELDCAGHDLRFKHFTDCQFTRCTFKEADFSECRFKNCVFIRCDLSLASFKRASLTDVKFEDSKVIGINWSEAAWSKQGLLNSIHFVNCSLNYSTFFGLTLNKLTISKCVAHDVDFTEANLTKANCTYTDFGESRFFKTNLTEADFTHATNYNIAANINTLKKTRFALPEAMSLLYSLDIVLVDQDGIDTRPE